MKFWASLALLTVCCSAADQTHPAPVTLQEQVDAEVRGFRGKVNVFAKNIDNGRTFSYRGDARVRTASTIKLAILAAAFAAVAEGQAKWDDRVTLRDEDKVSGAGVLGELSPGDSMTLRGLSHLMIVLSDNTATNMMLDHFPGDYVNNWADHFGLVNTKILRKIGGAAPSRAAFESTNAPYGLGVSTPREMVTLLEALEKGQVVSPDASKEIIDIMKRQQDRNGIPRHLSGITVANKTGSLDHLRSDVGIVYSKRGRIAMSITCDEIPQLDWSSDNPGYVHIAKIAQILTRGL
jgi:beta-lactamase class A